MPVRQRKYREKKAQNTHLTNQNSLLAQESAESNRQLRENEKELNQLLVIFNNDNKEREQLNQELAIIWKRKVSRFTNLQRQIRELQKQLNSAREERENYRDEFQKQKPQIQKLEEQRISLLFLAEKRRKEREEFEKQFRELGEKFERLNSVYQITRTELVHFEKGLNEEISQHQATQEHLRLAHGDISELKTANQNWETSYRLAQGKLNQISEREEKLLDDKYKEITTLKAKISQLEKEQKLFYYSQEEFEALFKEYKKAKQKLLNYQNSYQVLKGQFEKLSKIFHQRLDINRILQNKIFILKSQLDAANDENQTAHAVHANEINQVRKELEESKEKVKFFKKEP